MRGLRRGIARNTLRTGIKRGKKPRTAKKKEKTKAWSLNRADREFRAFMLKVLADEKRVICIFPGCNISDPAKLTVSHYFGRVNKATRFDIRNCDLLCRNHHYWDKQLGWEFQKQTKEKHGLDGRYTLYIKQKLGDEYTTLKALAESGMKPKVAIQSLQDKIKELKCE